MLHVLYMDQAIENAKKYVETHVLADAGACVKIGLNQEKPNK